MNAQPKTDDPRGVEEAVSVPPGYRRFVVVSSSGELLEDALIAERLATPAYIAQRHALLNHADPQRQNAPTLTVMRGGQQ